VCKSESIDDLYCSLSCKSLDLKNITKEENVIDKTTKLSKKSTVDQKHLLSKLENKVNKRKQLLTTSCSDNLIKENDDFDKQLINLKKPPIEENQSSLKLPKPTSFPEAIDDDYDDDNDDELYSDLKVLLL